MLNSTLSFPDIKMESTAMTNIVLCLPLWNLGFLLLPLYTILVPNAILMTVHQLFMGYNICTTSDRLMLCLETVYLTSHEGNIRLNRPHSIIEIITCILWDISHVKNETDSERTNSQCLRGERYLSSGPCPALETWGQSTGREQTERM